jgi:hypothetical protein
MHGKGVFVWKQKSCRYEGEVLCFLSLAMEKQVLWLHCATKNALCDENNQSSSFKFGCT